MKILCMLCLIFAVSALANQWIDPHDMNTNAKQKYIKPTIKKSASASSINIEVSDPAPDICYPRLKRIVGILINSAHIDKRDPDLYHGNIRFTIDPKEFEFLVNFGKDDITFEKLRKLDTVFTEGFKRTYVDEYLDAIESFQLKLYSLIVNSKNVWLIGAAFLLYVLYQLFKNNFSFAYIVKYFVIMILIADFGFRYHYLLEEAEEHNLDVVYSKECDSKQMSWGEWTQYIFSTRNCERKTVTPLDVFLYQIKNLIIIPMHAFGTGMGGFGTNMFTNLPWGLNLIMWPVLVIFTLLLLLFLMTICTGQSIEFNIFHLLKFKFGGGGHRESALMGPTVERLMNNALHRPMVQNVHVTLPSNNENSGAPLVQRSEAKKSKKSVLEQKAVTSSKKQKTTNRSVTSKNKSSDASSLVQISEAKESEKSVLEQEPANSSKKQKITSSSVTQNPLSVSVVCDKDHKSLS